MNSATYTLPHLDGRSAHALAQRLDTMLPGEVDFTIGLNRRGETVLRIIGATLLWDTLADLLASSRARQAA